MHIVFKMDSVEIKRAQKTLIEDGCVLPGWTIEPGLLSYEGGHEAFVQRLFDIDYIFRTDSDTIRPKLYKPDDIRFKWYEDLEKFLDTRSTWLEFALESKKPTIPPRFLSQSNIQRRMLNGEPPAILLHDYDEQLIVQVMAFMAKHDQLNTSAWSDYEGLKAA